MSESSDFWNQGRDVKGLSDEKLARYFRDAEATLRVTSQYPAPPFKITDYQAVLDSYKGETQRRAAADPRANAPAPTSGFGNLPGGGGAGGYAPLPANPTSQALRGPQVDFFAQGRPQIDFFAQGRALQGGQAPPGQAGNIDFFSGYT